MRIRSAVTAGGVIDIRATAQKLGVHAPLTLDELLQGGNADGLSRVVAGVALVVPTGVIAEPIFPCVVAGPVLVVPTGVIAGAAVPCG